MEKGPAIISMSAIPARPVKLLPVVGALKGSPRTNLALKDSPRCRSGRQRPSLPAARQLLKEMKSYSRANGTINILL
jgi:hypothetical protein